MHRSASTRISRKRSNRDCPSNKLAIRWISSRISALLGNSEGFSHPRHNRRAALILARKYSVSLREYIMRAASTMMPRLSFSSLIRVVSDIHSSIRTNARQRSPSRPTPGFGLAAVILRCINKSSTSKTLAKIRRTSSQPDHRIVDLFRYPFRNSR